MHVAHPLPQKTIARSVSSPSWMSGCGGKHYSKCMATTPRPRGRREPCNCRSITKNYRRSCILSERSSVQAQSYVTYFYGLIAWTEAFSFVQKKTKSDTQFSSSHVMQPRTFQLNSSFTASISKCKHFLCYRTCIQISPFS